jgi:hypothetical protein
VPQNGKNLAGDLENGSDSGGRLIGAPFFPDESEDAAVRKRAGRDHSNVEVMEKEIWPQAVVPRDESGNGLAVC